MSDLAQRLISSWDINSNLLEVTMRPTLESTDDSHDLVVAANVLAELDAYQSQSLLDSLAHTVSPGGYLLLLEPGQQLHTRQLMRLRDRVISEHSSLTPVFPCFRADSCPMLSQSPTDWCHDTLEWRQPPLSAQFDHLLGFNKHRIKYAAFLFQRHGALREGLRVITPPKKTRVGSEALVCGGSFYGVARLRKSARSEHNRAFEKAQVYERLLVSGNMASEVPANTTFKKLGTL
jgi:ribosomal protein RSM22 (predicted rRNA methylase)